MIDRSAWIVDGPDGRVVDVQGDYDIDRSFVELGSLTKLVTSTMLDVLDVRGVVGADDPVDMWSPAPRGTGITLRLLAQHRAGLPRLPPGTAWWRDDPYRGFDEDACDTVLRRLDKVRVAPAGSRERYSNLGYAVLGRVLAQAGGYSSWYAAATDLVLGPAGITDMTLHPPEAARLVGQDRRGVPRPHWTLDNAMAPAGGLWGTVAAMERLLAHLLPTTHARRPTSAWQVSGTVFWHNGATRDAASFLGVDMTSDRRVVAHTLGAGPGRTDTLALQLLALPPEESDG